MSVPETYKNEVPAPPMGDDILANIFLSVDITTVLHLDEVDSIMTLQYTLTLKWMDSRVTFRNLKYDTFLNTIDTRDASKIWYPKLLIYNTEDKEDTGACCQLIKYTYNSTVRVEHTLSLQFDSKSVITIERNGTANISPLTDVQNNHIYKGSENELILSRVYTTNFICEFELASYPFDIQKCSMIFVMQVKNLYLIPS